MSQNKLKTIIAWLLTIVFLFASIYSNAIFAAAASDGQETVTEGVYNIKNE